MGSRTAIFLILAAIVLSSCATPDKQPEDPDWNKAAVALFLIRSGYDRGAAACGHEWGKRVATRAVALANCTSNHKNSGLATDEIIAKRISAVARIINLTEKRRVGNKCVSNCNYSLVAYTKKKKK